MQRDVLKKTFTFHERFVLEVDPSQRFIKGLAELTIQPLNDKITNLKINCRHCKIEKVSVNDSPVEFEYADAVSDLTLGATATIAHHQVYKSRYLNALRDADEGELIVKLPANSIQQISNGDTSQSINQPQTREPLTNDASSLTTDKSSSALEPAAEAPQPIYTTLVIRIDYTLEDPRNGVVFVQKDDEIAPYRSNHVYTVNQPLPGSTRAWLPCIDNIADRCTWDMEFIVPRKDEGAIVPEYDGEGSFDEVDGMVVVCSGEVLEQVIHPTDTTKKIVHYRLSEPTPAPFIGFAIGPFKMIKLSPSQLQEEVMTAADLDESQQQSLMAEINMMSNIYAFALPGAEDELSVSCSFLMHAMHFYTQEYGSYPFSDYKLVFVEDAWSDTTSSASLSICSSRLLHPEDVIDQIYSTRRELSQALARQWFGIYIVQKSWPDTWLVRGIANLMGSLFIKRHLGNNEYRLRLKKDMELCCKLDINRPPVYNQALPYPLDPEDLEFIDLKAPLVIYMLDKRMCKGGGTLGLSRVLPKLLVSAMSGELAQNAISTHYFLRLCRKVSGFDTRVFAEQWIYKSGCPKFFFKFHFNRKKMVVEIHMSQENTNSSLAVGQEFSGAMDGSTVNYQELMSPLFTGNLTVRIHEADGTPYEHILDIQSTQHKFEVQFNTKYKRIRRNTKRFLAKQAAAAAAVAEEEQENEEGTEGNMVLGIIPTLGLGMPIFEDPNQKKDWRIYEWGQDEEDTSGAASAMFDWIRLDAEFEWLCICDFKQPDYMWAAQLTKDRDVVAQHEAIDALKHMPSLPTSTSFLRAVLDPKCFYKIRMEAAYGLASCAIPSLNWIGLHQLNKMFNKRYCFPVSSHAQAAMVDEELPMVTSIPKPNNFTSLPDYFIQKASVVAFSQIRDDRGLTPVRIRQFLLDLLKYNDNIGNEFSDCYYVSTLVSSLGDSLIPANDDVVDDIEGEHVNTAAMAEIERFRTLDYVIPTYHNIITVTCLRTMTKLMLKNLLPVNISMFMQYTRYGNYVEIRLTAFDSLFILCGLSDPVLNRYLLDVIKEDPCVFVSHYVARAMLAWLGLAMKQSSESPTGPTRYVEEFAEEEGRVIIDDDRLPIKKTAQQEFQASIENLRKRFENDTALQQNLWDLLNSSQNAKLDHCIRKYLLQFCEYMFKPIDVGLKVTIRVPTLPPQNTEDNSEPPTPTSAPIIRLNKPKHRPEDKPPKQKKTNSIHIKTENLSNDASLTSANTVSSPLSIDSMDTSNSTINEEVENRTIVETPSKPKPVINVEKTAPVSSPISTPSAPIATEAPKPKPKKVHGIASEEIKKCRRVLNKLTKLECALYFTHPVDEVLDQAPGYYSIIKKPIDLSMIKAKVVAKEYTTLRQFEDDIRLMINNCYSFNPPGSHVYTKGQDLEAAFERELQVVNGKEAHDDTQNMTIVESPASTPRISNATIPAPSQSNNTKASTSSANPTSVVIKPPKPAKVKSINTTTTASPAPMSSSPVKPPTTTNMSSPQPPQDVVMTERKKSITPVDKQPKPTNKYAHLSEYEKMDQLLTKTMASPHAFEFLRPVDPIKQGIPHYTQIIKHPMDLGKIKSQLRNRQYPNAQAMNADMHLMFNNCYTFNPPGTYVYNESKSLQELYEKEWKSYFGKRRPSTDVTKKPKETHPTPPASEPISSDAISPVVKQNTIRIKPLDKPGSPSSAPKVSAKPPKAPKPPKEASPSVNKPATPNLPPTEPIAAVIVPLPITEKSRSKPPAYPMNEANKEKCQRVMKKLWSLKESEPFRKPVDVVALNIPTYYEIVKRPMDLSLIQKKLDNSEYNTVWDLERDIRQMFWNCYGFNHPESIVVTQSRTVEKFFHQIWSAEFSYPDAIKGEERAIASKVVDKLTLHDAACWFNEPVDTVALPDYLTVVKHPMDLRTIWERLESGKYTSLKALDHDIRLVFKNCAAYNRPETVAAADGAKLERYYNSISKEMRARINGNTSNVSPSPSSSKKRRPSSSPAPVKMTHSVSASTEEPPAKMQKLSSSQGSNVSPSHQAKKDNHHKKDHPPKPVRKPSIKEEEAVPYMSAMDIDPIMGYSSVSPSEVLINPAAAVRPHAVVKSPVVGAVSQSHSPTSTQSPSVMSKSSNASPVSSSPLGTNKSTSQEAPTKLHPAMYAKLESLLRKMMNHRCAFGFTEPVDPVALNIPHYPMIVKKPMDFGTMMNKLKSGQYKCVRDFESDMRLIFTNCYTFNGFEHPFSENAKILEQILNKEASSLRKKEAQLKEGISTANAKPSSNNKSSSSKSSHSSGKPSNNKPASSSKIPDDISPEKAELRKYKSVLDKLMSHESYYAFGAPVDPVLLQIPTYFDIIKKPMDFGTIRKKYERGKYANGDQLLRDVEQVFINCYLFNIPDDVVTRMGHSVQREFNRLCRARGLKTVNVDIPDSDDANPNNTSYDSQFHAPSSTHL